MHADNELEEFKRHFEKAKKFQVEMQDALTTFLVEWQNKAIAERVSVTIPPGDFVLLGAMTSLMFQAMRPYGLNDLYIAECFGEHMRWMDRKVKEFKSRN